MRSREDRASRYDVVEIVAARRFDWTGPEETARVRRPRDRGVNRAIASPTTRTTRPELLMASATNPMSAASPTTRMTRGCCISPADDSYDQGLLHLSKPQTRALIEQPCVSLI